MKTAKTKVVKCWGVYAARSTHGIVWCASYFRHRMPLAVFSERADAEDYYEQIKEPFNFYKILPCTISFTIPKKTK